MNQDDINKNNIDAGKSREYNDGALILNIKPEDPNVEGDLADLSGDGPINVAQFVMSLFINAQIEVPVLVEIDGVVRTANSIVYGIKDKKPYIRIVSDNR